MVSPARATNGDFWLPSVLGSGWMNTSPPGRVLFHGMLFLLDSALSWKCLSSGNALVMEECIHSLPNGIFQVPETDSDSDVEIIAICPARRSVELENRAHGQRRMQEDKVRAWPSGV